MQWTSGSQGGFTSGEPWIGVNSNHTSINAEAQLGDDDSIFNYYRRLIALRKTYDVIAYGDFKPLDVRHPSVFAYKRTYGNETLFVVCNFYGKPLTWESGESFEGCRCILDNYENPAFEAHTVTLRPYEAVVLYKA